MVNEVDSWHWLAYLPSVFLQYPAPFRAHYERNIDTYRDPLVL